MKFPREWELPDFPENKNKPGSLLNIQIPGSSRRSTESAFPGKRPVDLYDNESHRSSLPQKFGNTFLRGKIAS